MVAGAAMGGIPPVSIASQNSSFLELRTVRAVALTKPRGIFGANAMFAIVMMAMVALVGVPLARECLCL